MFKALYGREEMIDDAGIQAWLESKQGNPYQPGNRGFMVRLGPTRERHGLVSAWAINEATGHQIDLPDSSRPGFRAVSLPVEGTWRLAVENLGVEDQDKPLWPGPSAGVLVVRLPRGESKLDLSVGDNQLPLSAIVVLGSPVQDEYFGEWTSTVRLKIKADSTRLVVLSRAHVRGQNAIDVPGLAELIVHNATLQQCDLRWKIGTEQSHITPLLVLGGRIKLEGSKVAGYLGRNDYLFGGDPPALKLFGGDRVPVIGDEASYLRLSLERYQHAREVNVDDLSYALMNQLTLEGLRGELVGWAPDHMSVRLRQSILTLNCSAEELRVRYDEHSAVRVVGGRINGLTLEFTHPAPDYSWLNRTRQATEAVDDGSITPETEDQWLRRQPATLWVAHAHLARLRGRVPHLSIGPGATVQVDDSAELWRVRVDPEAKDASLQGVHLRDLDDEGLSDLETLLHADVVVETAKQAMRRRAALARARFLGGLWGPRKRLARLRRIPGRAGNYVRRLRYRNSRGTKNKSASLSELGIALASMPSHSVYFWARAVKFLEVRHAPALQLGRARAALNDERLRQLRRQRGGRPILEPEYVVLRSWSLLRYGESLGIAVAAYVLLAALVGLVLSVSVPETVPAWSMVVRALFAPFGLVIRQDFRPRNACLSPQAQAQALEASWWWPWWGFQVVGTALIALIVLIVSRLARNKPPS